MDHSKKNEYADTSDLCADYPGYLSGLGKLTYDAVVGLLLNCERQQIRQSWAVKRGIDYAFSKTPISKSVFEAVTSTPEEASETAYNVNSERRLADLMRKRGWN